MRLAGWDARLAEADQLYRQGKATLDAAYPGRLTYNPHAPVIRFEFGGETQEQMRSDRRYTTKDWA